MYRLVYGHLPWSDGHRKYEAVPVLERALAPWPAAHIVLTSTQPWAKGIEPVLEQLGPSIAARVIGFTFQDLTRFAKLGPRQSPIGSNDYWRLAKSEVVRMHREWLRPAAWIAIDDETILWTDDERRTHLVSVDGCKGLLRDTVAQDRLLTLLTGQLGPAA